MMIARRAARALRPGVRWIQGEPHRPIAPMPRHPDTLSTLTCARARRTLLAVSSASASGGRTSQDVSISSGRASGSTYDVCTAAAVDSEAQRLPGAAAGGGPVPQLQHDAALLPADQPHLHIRSSATAGRRHAQLKLPGRSTIATLRR
jgi:hypothetical protein